jgi:hypothetical protein
MMTVTEKTDNPPLAALPAAPRDEGERLLARYGDQLEDDNMTDAQKQEFLLALWQILRAFVDLGFSVRGGDKLTPESDLGLDDVLEYLIPEDTAHETVAPEKPNNKEQR